MKYGIKFPIQEVQYGKSVNFLDLCVHLDENNNIHYRGYTKPTDAKRYLNPSSFHYKSVFNAIPFSQVLRTLRNNSTDETRTTDLEICIKSFVNSGYDPTKLNDLKAKAIEKFTTDSTISTTNQNDTLVFPIHYFEGIADFKKVVESLRNEFRTLLGETRVMLAMKKLSSIGNIFVRNKQLSLPQLSSDNQKCNQRGCLQCPIVNNKRKLTINGSNIHIPTHLNCKSKHVIYMWNCNLCGVNETYFGRTTQELHDRTSGHRTSFNDATKFDKSALSMHAMEMHQDSFSLDNFTVAAVSKVSPQQLRREEFRYIDKYRTLTLGLNRYKV